MSRLTRDGTAEPVSRDQILRHGRGQENIYFFCSADHVQDWQPYPVDPHSYFMCDHTCRRPDSHTCFFFFWRCRFFRVFFCIIPAFSLYGEYLSFRMVFFYLVTTGWIFDISLYENSIKNVSIKLCYLVPSPSETWFRGMSVGGSFRRE